MISDSEIQVIGTLLKPHGIKGEINLELNEEIELDKLRCIVIKIDGINVPFFINSVRPKASFTRLVIIDGIESEQDAKDVCGQSVYALKNELPEALIDTEDDGRFYISDLVGFDVLLSDGTKIGKVMDYDDSTDNVLLIVQPETEVSKRIFIPIADEFVDDLQLDNRKIVLDLPDGLVNIND